MPRCFFVEGVVQNCSILYKIVVTLELSSLIHGRYRLLEPLGQGGLATTFLVEDLVMGRRLALKLLSEESLSLATTLHGEFLTLRNLVHPRLVRVYDFGRVGPVGEQRAFYTAALVEGEPLDRYCEGKAWGDVEQAVIDVLEALRFLHGLGVIHGDIHPHNVLVDRSGRATVVDLSCSQPIGIARVACGHPGYVALEVIDGGHIDGRADLFSLGATLETLREGLRDGLPGHVNAMVRRLREPSPDRRPADTEEVLEALGVDLAELVLPTGRSIVMVGRDAELQSFRDMLGAVEADAPGPRAMAIVGPDGIGRSRLLQEMKWEAQQRCHVIEGAASQRACLFDMVARAVESPSTHADVETFLEGVDELVQGQHGQVAMFLDDVHRLDEAGSSLLSGMLRTVPSSGSLLFVCTGLALSSVGRETLRRVELGPLREAELSPLIGSAVSPEALPDIVEATSGIPGLVVAIVDQLRAGQIGVDEVAEAVHPRPETVEERFGALDRASRDALGKIVLLSSSRSELFDGDLSELGVADETLARLMLTGWVRREGSIVKLARTIEAGVVMSCLGDLQHAELRQAIVTWLERRASEERDRGSKARVDELEAELVAHMAAAGDVEAAVARFFEISSGFRDSPESYRMALDEILRRTTLPDLLLHAAELEERSGHPERARPLIDTLFDSHGYEPWIQRGCRIEASCLLKLGDAKGALESLRHLESEAGEPRCDGVMTDLRARALIKLGRYREALADVEATMREEPEHDIAVELLLDAGLAASYMGDTLRAREALARARALIGEADDPHLRARCLSYEALNEFRWGNLSDAARGFEATLVVARDHGLVDQIAHAALNLGTTYHQMGDLGRALSSYSRALRLAVAIGAVSAEATLRHNLATLYFDAGLTERSKSAVARAEAAAGAAGSGLLAAESISLRGHIALVEGDQDSAQGALLEARERFIALEVAGRELVETDLHLARLRLERGELSDAVVTVDRSIEALRELGVTDLHARALTLSGEVSIARGELSEAIHKLEEAKELAYRGQSRLVEAISLRLLAEVYERTGAGFLARQRRLRARELLEGIASGLPSEWCSALWERYGAALRHLEDAHDDGPSRRESKLRRLLDLTTSLSASLDAKEVLERTMDVAIEVTGAERGFIILAVSKSADSSIEDRGRSLEKESLSVAVARNIDRERLGRSGLKFSRSIAHQVIRTGEPMVTTDAMSDHRFQSHRSIHAMKLRSIVCVPIRDAASIIGALYVDNRFQRGRFSEEDTDLLLAFANHVAVALINARLHGELARKTVELGERARELEMQRERIEGLLAEKSERLDELQQRLDVTQEALEHRYDYSNIVGRSPAMDAVLQQLDRLIPTSTTVLLRGESGTGKELCARAIHYNGPRRQAPFVSVNCGAIPEPLLESELFGHVRGAFTDAREDKKGLLLAAQGGTLLLDEVGEMSSSMQVKLLRAIEERRVRPVGGTQAVAIDIRLLCATHRDLLDEVAKGSFRQDLYYRLAVVEVGIPPLRERPSDIPLLAEHLLHRVARELDRRLPKLSTRALRAMIAFSWPGNVRQLENVLTKATLLAHGQVIHTKDLALPTTTTMGRVSSEQSHSSPPSTRESFELVESQEIAELLTAYRWNVTKTAQHLGLSRTTLYAKMRKYGLSRR